MHVMSLWRVLPWTSKIALWICFQSLRLGSRIQTSPYRLLQLLLLHEALLPELKVFG